MKSANAYAASILSLIIEQTRTRLLQPQSRPLFVEIYPGNMQGRLLTPDVGLYFNDGATLRIDEEFKLDGKGNVERTSYVYHYERPGGYYFRFEREKHDDDQLYKPEHHLHVLWRLPHFPALPIILPEMFDFIRINFYSSHRPRLVGQSLSIQI